MTLKKKVRLEVVEGYVRSVLHLPNVPSDEFETYSKLLSLLRESLSKDEILTATRYLGGDR